MPSILGRIAKWLLTGVGVLVILLALATGVFRLLVAQLPAAQADLEAWVAAELGLRAEFEQLDGRWGLRGPELALTDVRIGDASGAMVAAERVVVGLDALALVVERQPRVGRLVIDGLELTIERTPEGAFRLVGTGAETGGRAGIGPVVPADVEVTIRDGRIRYVDAARGRQWDLADVSMTVARTGTELAIDARAVPPPDVAARIELTLAATLGPAGEVTEWRLDGDLAAADLAQLAELAPAEIVPEIGGRGDVSLAIEGSVRRVTRAAATVALRNVVLPRPDGGSALAYERVAVSAEWTASATGGWQLALEDLEVERNGRRWARSGATRIDFEAAGGALRHLGVQSDFLRLEDVTPIVLAFADAVPAGQWIDHDPRGDLSALDFVLERDADGLWDYGLAVEFEGLGLAATAGQPGVAGLTGSVTTGARSGSIDFRSADVTLDWPELFAAPLAIESLAGSLVWRQGRDAVRVVGNELTLGVLGTSVESSLELALPLDGSAPLLDIDARAARFDLVAAKAWLPVGKMPRAISNWLLGSIRAGTAHDIELELFGPADAFPFDAGEGGFRVAADLRDVELAYVRDWPVAEEIAGTIEFVNAGFEALCSGRSLGNVSDSFRVAIPDMRTGELELDVTTAGPLGELIAFVRGTPLLASRLGPSFASLSGEAGTGSVDLELDLPLRNRAAFALDATVAIADGQLAIDGFGPKASEINGVLEVGADRVQSERIDAVFLEGPVHAAIVAPDRPGYGTMLVVDGETTIDGAFAAFGLPFADRVAGQTQWRGRLMLPTRASESPGPVRIEIESNLSGVALRLPEPFAKAPDEPSNLQLDFTLAAGGELAVDGNLGATRRLALRFARRADGYAFERGAVVFGGGEPELPAGQGLSVRGRLGAIDGGEWLGLAGAGGGDGELPGLDGAGGGNGAASALLEADLELAELTMFGQRLGSSRLTIHREPDHWAVGIDSEPVAGDIRVPRSLAPRPQIVANMTRLYLAVGDDPGSAAGGDSAGSAAGGIDPRTLPGIALDAQEFGLGSARLGHVVADVFADPSGVRLTSFTGTTGSFVLEGTGSWLEGPTGPMTRVAASLSAMNVGATLAELGFGPFMEGELADVTASVYWAGAPGPGWLDHVGGDVALVVQKGSLLGIEPGAGRVVGLLSVAALPRRLALDFRDVFNRGFVFDDITGDFSLIDGNAYTDNLKMSGPSAEIGIIGRTGLRDRDYQQQAVVTAEPSNVLPTVGALVAGPGVGAAWLIFTQIFKKPLRGIGRAAYCVTGTWEAPAVERLSGERVDQVEQCAGLPPDGFSANVRE